MTYGDILLLHDRPVAYRPVLRRICGSTNAALVLAQLLYWQPRAGDPEHLRKSDTELHRELGLSADELATARARLIKAGYITARREGSPATMHYRVHLDAIKAAIERAGQPPAEDREAAENRLVTVDASESAKADALASKSDETRQTVKTLDPAARRIAEARAALAAGQERHKLITARANAALNLNINWDTKTGRAFYRFLAERDANGEAVETYAAWHMSDPWRAQNITSPARVMELWPRAFAAGAESRPRQRYTNDQVYQ